MSDVKAWAEIDASPLLQLPPAERARLKETNDARYRAFWEDCFLAALGPGQKNADNLNSSAFCEVFLYAFSLWEPKPGQTFSIYLRSAVKHRQTHLLLEEEPNGFGRETNRKVKKALEYMAKNGITEVMLTRNPKALQMLAELVGIGAKTLREALQSKRTLLSLDDTGGTDSPLADCIADESESVEQQVEQAGELLPWLHRGLGVMSLAQKEAYGQKNGLLWSSVLMGYLRNRDVLPPAEDAPNRLANCDDLRPLERDNCLWDVLLMRRYVAFTVCPPYTPKELEHAALNRLQQPDRNPAQDKTVAELLGVSKAAISQRRVTWQKNLLQMKTEQEER